MPRVVKRVPRPLRKTAGRTVIPRARKWTRIAKVSGECIACRVRQRSPPAACNVYPTHGRRDSVSRVPPCPARRFPPRGDLSRKQDVNIAWSRRARACFSGGSPPTSFTNWRGRIHKLNSVALGNQIGQTTFDLRRRNLCHGIRVSDDALACQKAPKRAEGGKATDD